MGVIILSEAEPRAKEIAEFARQPDNWYLVGVSNWVPGDRSEYVLKSGTIKAVFTWTLQPSGEVFRHLTVSSHKLPHPYIVWTMAHYFGFTGAEVDEVSTVLKPADTWEARVVERDGCIAVIQEI